MAACSAVGRSKHKPHIKWGSEIEIVSNKDPTIVRIPDILTVKPIRVQPQSVIVVLNVKHVQIAIGVNFV